MALDERYLWTFAAKDAHDRDITIGVGIDVDSATGDASVIVSAPGWFRLDDDVAGAFGYRLQTAAELVRQRRS